MTRCGVDDDTHVTIVPNYRDTVVLMFGFSGHDHWFEHVIAWRVEDLSNSDINVIVDPITAFGTLDPNAYCFVEQTPTGTAYRFPEDATFDTLDDAIAHGYAEMERMNLRRQVTP
jgi:hypothetical protein